MTHTTIIMQAGDEQLTTAPKTAADREDRDAKTPRNDAELGANRIKSSVLFRRLLGGNVIIGGGIFELLLLLRQSGGRDRNFPLQWSPGKTVIGVSQ